MIAFWTTLKSADFPIIMYIYIHFIYDDVIFYWDGRVKAHILTVWECTWRQQRSVRRWRHPVLDGQLKGRDFLLTFCFARVCLDFFFGTFHQHSQQIQKLVPSRLSSGILQRWNGCLKRTIPSVKRERKKRKGDWIVIKQELILVLSRILIPSFLFVLQFPYSCFHFPSLAH